MTSDHSVNAFGRSGNSESFRSHHDSSSGESAPSDRAPDARFHDDDSVDRPAGDEPSSGGASPADAASDDTGARPKRRRGSRGGRRRRGRGRTSGAVVDASVTEGPIVREDPVSESGGFDDESDEERLRDDLASEGPETGDARIPDLDDAAPADGDDSAPADDDDASAEAPRAPGEPGTKKRRRRGRRRRGRGGAERAATEAGAVEPLLPDEDDLAPHVRARVPRELDALDAEDGGPDFAADAAWNDAPAGDDEGATSPDDEAALEDAPRGEARAEGATDDPNGPRKKRRRRGTRGGRRRKQKLAESRGPRTEELDAPLELEAIPGEDDDLPALPTAVVEEAPEADEGRRGRSRRRRRGEERASEDLDDEDLPTIPESQRNSLILVNATDPEEQRVAVVESERIVDFQMTVKDQDSLVNDIYRGRVVNLEPAIGAAFIDFGQGRNGFLHTSDVLSVYGDKDWSLDKLLSTQIDPEEWDAGSSQPSVGAELSDDEGGEKAEASPKESKKHRRPKGKHERRFRSRPRLPITDLLKKGQMVVVQVTKDAIGDKGPTLTTYISIPGRYLVLMPSMARTGVSRKIEDEKERKRLKRILQSLDVPEGMGVIVRTAGVGHSKAEIKRDLDYLKSAWEAFGKRLSVGHGPAPLYRESDVAIRTMRDLFTPTTKAVIVDDPEVHRHITEFTEKLMPENVERVKLHDGPRPLFQSYGIEPDFEKIFSRRIELPSGGSIVFDQAEALVAIDVNSGRTRSDGFDFEEIALKTNLEAVPEIARQIRLRDLGGIIVCDFIDMMKMGNIRTVERAFKAALELDRARSKVGRISQFGLMELTRQRLGPGIAKKAFHTCPRCRGTGRIRTVNSRAAAILRRLGSAMTLKGFSTVEVKAHPEVVAYLKDQCNEYIRALEYRFQREVKLYDAPDQHEDSVLRYLRADGKEVRPGGRRKR